MRKQKTMIVNKHTLELARKQLAVQYKKTYLVIQKALLTLFNKGIEKDKVATLIKETGDNYKK